MTHPRIRKLEKLGFEWALISGRNVNVNPLHKKIEKIAFQWDVMYDRLVEHKRLYGDVNVTNSFEDDEHLVQWVQDQKRRFKAYSSGLKINGMNKEKYHLLEKIGFQKTVGNYRNNNLDGHENSGSSFDSESEISSQSDSEDKARSDQLNESTSSIRRSVNSFVSGNKKESNGAMKQKMQNEKEDDKQSDYEDEEDKIFFDAVARCGKDANMDSIAEVVLNKYAVRKSKASQP